MPRITSAICGPLAALAIGWLGAVSASAGDAVIDQPAARPFVQRYAPPAYRTPRMRGGYRVYARPYRTYYALGYETGNEIGFEGQEFNLPGTDNRRGYRRIVPRYALHGGLDCRPRPVYGPDGQPWVTPFDFNCW